VENKLSSVDTELRQKRAYTVDRKISFFAFTHITPNKKQFLLFTDLKSILNVCRYDTKDINGI